MGFRDWFRIDLDLFRIVQLQADWAHTDSAYIALLVPRTMVIIMVGYMNDGLPSFTGGAVVKKLPASAADIRDIGSVPGPGRSLGGGHCNPLQYSCLENPMDKGVWWATVHRVMSGEHVISLVLSHHNKNLKWQMLKPSARRSSWTDCATALGSPTDPCYSSILFRK